MNRCIVVGLGLLLGCAVERTPPPKGSKAAAKPQVAKAEAKAPEAKAPEAKAPEAKAEAKAPEPAPTTAVPPAEDAKGGAPPQDPGSALAQRFRDPPWFRKTLFPGAEVTKTARSEADDNGLFHSLITFKLADGDTTETCVKNLKKKVGPSVSNLEKSEPGPGRVQLTGSTDRYKVTLLCGDAKGAMSAYVAFEWTS